MSSNATMYRSDWERLNAIAHQRNRVARLERELEERVAMLSAALLVEQARLQQMERSP